MLYQISSEAQDDLFEIWQRIAQDNVDLANRIEGELYSFLVIYDPESKPLRIMAVRRGKRNIKRILKERS
jgi:plasmid stabilization system protein ParE